MHGRLVANSPLAAALLYSCLSIFPQDQVHAAPTVQLNLTVSKSTLQPGQAVDLTATAVSSTKVTSGALSYAIRLGSTRIASKKLSGVSLYPGKPATRVFTWTAPSTAASGTYLVTATYTSGKNTYATASSSFAVIAAPTAVNGECGAANGTITATAPVEGLCAVGTNTTITADSAGLWTWSCQGTNGGQDALCTTLPPSTGTSSAQLGVFTGDMNIAELQAFETTLGRPADFVTLFTANSTWNDFDSTNSWCCAVWGLLDFWKTNRPGQKIVMTVLPIATDGASTLAQAATGAYNSHWHNMAKTIAAYDPTMVIRPFHEFNLSSNNYFAGRDPAAFIAAWKHFVSTFRSVSPQFKFIWNLNIGAGDMNNPEVAYPGDGYVDYIAMDVYELSVWQKGYTQQQRWEALTNAPYTLNWLKAFAGAHNKPIGFPEYGSDWNDGFFPAQMALWIKANNVALHSYWNFDGGAPFNDSFTSNPLNAAAYFSAWK